MKLVLAEPFKTLWAGRDAFAAVEQRHRRFGFGRVDEIAGIDTVVHGEEAYAFGNEK